MGHHGGTYEEFYMPTLIERDFISIYFGTPSQDELIKHAARMEIRRDLRAPMGLNDEQKLAFQLELEDHPEIQKHSQRRKQCVQKLKEKGYRPLIAGEGTKWHNNSLAADRKLRNLKSLLRKRRETQVILKFHRTIDGHDIERQLSGKTGANIPTRSTVKYEFRQCAVIASLLVQPLHELEEFTALKLRFEFVSCLVTYGTGQESQQDEVTSSVGVKRSISSDAPPHPQTKRQSKERSTSVSSSKVIFQGWRVVVPTTTAGGLIRRPSGGLHASTMQLRQRQPIPAPTRKASPAKTRSTVVIKQKPKDDEMEIVPSPSPFPMRFDEPVCLICIGNTPTFR